MTLLFKYALNQLPLIVVFAIGVGVIVTKLNYLSKDVIKLEKKIEHQFEWCSNHYKIKD